MPPQESPGKAEIIEKPQTSSSLRGKSLSSYRCVGNGAITPTCKNGGNAMVFLGDSEAGFHSGFGYSQQRVKARAIVLFVFPKETW